MSIISMKNIRVKYDKNVVIDNLSLEVERGENLAIVGPSSCGKTSLMRALCGFIKISEGEISINDRLVSSPTQRVMVPPEKRNIGVVFQDYAVWPHLSVIENIIYPLKKRKVPKQEAKERAMIALNQVKMSEYGNRYPSQLSGGQQQRVALARALVSSAELIVLDEPITNLDATLREEMAYEIRNLQQSIGVTVIYITHDQETAMTISNRMVIMDKKGYIQQIGTPEDIWNNPKDIGVYSFLGVSNFLPVTPKNKLLHLNSDVTSQKMALGALKIPSKSESYLLASRPMDVRLHLDDGGADEFFLGKVERVTYLGNQFDYIVSVNDYQIRVQEDSLEAFKRGVPAEGSFARMEFLSPSLYVNESERDNSMIKMNDGEAL